MFLSIVFSLVIYQVASSEIQSRIRNFQNNVQSSLESNEAPLLDRIIHLSEDLQASDKLIVELFYVNIVVLVGGGFISYFLARRSLVPIKKVHEAQSRFTSDTSHELRTPLAVMKTELEVSLRDKDATVDSLKQVLASNLEEVDKLSKLAEMLLNLSQLDNTTIKLGAVNLNKVTNSVINKLKLPNKRIVITSARQQIICGNDMAILDLVKVLIDNALLYSPKESTINIAISKKDDYYAKFMITNSGPGIKPDKMPYIFDRFYRADDSRTNGENKGYGLGLALAKNIAELHNGSLSVNSIPNDITTFTLILPVNSNQPKNAK
jgi:signal transduction histidine kinase